MVSAKVVVAVTSIIFGILVIAFPGLLRWIIGLYFILSGLLTLLLP
ncbi:MAG: DUF3096 domain-containing protein [Candidatus Woesearchaeota archaeon]